MAKRDEAGRRKVCGTGAERSTSEIFSSLVTEHQPPYLSRYAYGPVGWPTGTEEAEEEVAAYPRLLLYSTGSLREPAVEEKVTYDDFKRDMTHIIHGAVEGAVDVRIRRTEQLICDRLELTESQILSAIKDSPFAAMKLLSKIGLAAFALFFALYVICDIYLVNPYFSLFGVLSCSLYLAMSKFGESRQNKGRKTRGTRLE